MKLWVGILFLVVSSQLGINARPIPRPIAADHHFVNDQQDVYGENSLETQPREQEDHNDEHSATDHGGEEEEDHNDENSATDHGGEEEDHNDEHSATDHGGEEENHNDENSATDHGGEEEDHNDENSATDHGGEEDHNDENSATDHGGEGEDHNHEHSGTDHGWEGEDHNHEHSGTDHGGEEMESIGHLYASIKNGQGIGEDNEYIHGEFPYEDEDITAKQLFPSHEKHLGTVNKRADENIMDDKADASTANFMETQREEEEDNIENNTETEREEDETESIGKYGSVRNRRGVVEKDEDANDDFPLKHSSHHFGSMYTDTIHREDEIHLGTGDKRKDDTMDDNPDEDNENSLETQTEEQGNIEHNSESGHGGDVFESTGHYRESAKEARSVTEEDEDFHDEFSFEDSRFHFRPIYTDATYQENVAPGHSVLSQKKHFSAGNKKADDDIMNQKPDAYETYSLESPTEEQVNTKLNSEIEQNGDIFESTGQYHGSANEAQGIVKDEFPFEDSRFHFQPIYTDATYHEDTAPKHFVPLHEKHHSTDNKKVDVDIMDQKPDAYEKYSLESPTKEQVNTEHNSENEQNGDTFESTGHYHGSANEAQGIVEDEFPFEDSPFHFRPIYTDAVYQEDTAPKHSVSSHEKHLGTENKKVDDDIMDQKPNAYETHSLESPTEEQVNIEHNSETGQNGDVFESTGHYHGSAKETRGMVEDDKDVHDEFPFEDSPFHFRPIYTDATYQEDTAPKHFVPLHEKLHGADNKKANGDIMDGNPDACNANSLEGRPEDQEDNFRTHSETEEDDVESESIGHYGLVRNGRGMDTYLEDKERGHFVPLHEQDHGMDKKETGTNADGFHSQRRVSRKSNENADPKTGTTYRETKTPEESKNEFNEEGRVLFENVDSFGNTYNDVIGLATRFRVTESEVSQENDAEVSNEDMAAEYVENGVYDELAAFKPSGNGKDLVSHDDDNLQGESKASQLSYEEAKGLGEGGISDNFERQNE